MSDDLEELRTRDPRSLTRNGPEIRSIIAFYRSKRKDFLFPPPKETKTKKKPDTAGPAPKISVDDLFG